MFNWRRVWLIAQREWTTRVHQRSFIVTSIIQVVLILAAALIPLGVAKFSGDDSNETISVVVVDQTDAGVAERLQPYLAPVNDDMAPMAISTDADSPEDARSMVDNGDADYALIAAQGENGLAYTIYNESGESSDAAQRLSGAVSSLSVEQRLEDAGLSADQVRRAFAPPTIQLAKADETEASDGSPGGAEIAIAYASAIIMFMAVMQYGTWIAQGVVEEKSSRIMEIMVNAATPRDLLAGKVSGIMLAALTQLVPILLVGALVFGLQPQLADLVNVSSSSLIDIDFAAISLRAAGLFFVYFILGFLLYGCVYAGLGSMVSRQEEVNQAISPMLTFMMIGYAGAFVVLASPNSLIAKILSIVPLTSPFTAVGRALLGDFPAWQLVLSIVLLAVTVLIGAWLAGRLYRVGVLLYGQKPSLREMLKLSRMQTVTR